jgi:hypothetical protein
MNRKFAWFLIAVLIMTAFISPFSSEALPTPQRISNGVYDNFEGDGDTEGNNRQIFNDSVLNNESFHQYYNNEENQPNYGERFTAGIIISTVNWVFKVLGIQDPVLMVFGKNPREDQADTFLTGGKQGESPRDSLILGVFPEKFFEAISYLYGNIEKLIPIPLVLFLVLIGFLLVIQGGSDEGRSKVKDYFLAFIVAIVTLRFGHSLWILVFEINYLLVDLIWYSLIEYGIKVGLFLDMVWGSGSEGFNSFANAVPSLGVAIIVFFAAIMSAVLNYQYALRMIILSILFLVFPIATTMSIFPKYRHSLQVWWQEFIANVFIQFAHAFALGLFFLSLQEFKTQSVSIWVVFAYFFGLPTIVGMFRSMIGLQHGGNNFMGSVGAMMGVNALMNMGRLFKENHRLSQGNDLVDGAGEFNGGASTDLSSIPPTIPIRNKINTGARVLGNKWGKGALGATGATAGALLSTMATGNPMLGAVAGAGAGKLVGDFTGKLGSSVDGSINMFKDYRQWKGGSGETGTSVNIAEPLEEPPSNRSLANFMESRYMSGKGGTFNNATVKLGWGMQRLDHLITSGKVENEAIAKRNFIKEQQGNYQSAAQGLRDIQPEYTMAKDNLSEMKSTYGPGSKWYNENSYENEQGKIIRPEKPMELVHAEERYHAAQARQSHLKNQANEARLNLTNHERMMSSIKPLIDSAPFSQQRGGL